MKAKTVDEYINQASPEAKEKLEEIRQIIKDEAPKATEKISYSMPFYDYFGRLAYFAGFKDHISLFVMRGVLDDFKDDVNTFRSGKATLRFPIDKDLPKDLIRKLIRATVKKIEK